MKGWKVEVSKGQYRKGKRNKEKDIKDLDDIDVIFEMVVIIMLPSIAWGGMLRGAGSASSW